MKLRKIAIHNCRSITDASIETGDYTLLVGANNSGKSNFMVALRLFYEDIKWTSADVPKIDGTDGESWVELTFELTEDEWASLADKYKAGVEGKSLRVRRFFRSADKDRVKASQSNIYGYVDGQLDADLFYGAKNIGSAKLGQIVPIPALAAPEDQTKLSGPSPLREVLNFVLKRVVASNATFAELAELFQKLNDEARGEKGFLREVADPLNQAISAWNIKIDLSVNAVKPEDISKNLLSFSFLDAALGDASFDLNRYGHGFQRSVIYELIRLAPKFRDEKVPDKKEFNPDLTIILFEEPEAFLHPAQQENMAFHLQRLAGEPTEQVILSTHSNIFVGKSSDNISQIIRFCRREGASHLSQVREAEVGKLFAEGGALLAALQAFVADPNIPDNRKGHARQLIQNPPQQHIAEAEERFRYQLWLDGERSSMFFADRVLLVEGASERALFHYLLAGEWHDLCRHRVCVVDVLGKFNFHRFMALLNAFAIPYGLILDDDQNQGHHLAINDLVSRLALEPISSILAEPAHIPDCLEVFLGLPRPAANRDDKKPVEILKAVTGGHVSGENLNSLRQVFERALAL